MQTLAKNRLLIRADAAASIGTGHVMRMIALAQAYNRRGGMCTIATVRVTDGLVARLRREAVFHERINSERQGSLEDAEKTITLAKKLGVEWIVVDGYHFDYDYQTAIKAAGLRLLCVDDHGYSDCWHCDAILNQNLDAECLRQYDNDIEDATYLLGSNFCLLRDEFIDRRSEPRDWKCIERLLLTLGGADPNNATEATLKLLNAVSKRRLHIRVLSSADNSHLERLQAFESHHRIEVLQGLSNMTDQYAWADGIISAGGSTCWEWLYFGLPGAIVTIADNQVPLVTALTGVRRAAISLGWFNAFDQKLHGELLSSWLDNPESAVDRKSAEILIDGKGASRVIERMLQ